MVKLNLQLFAEGTYNASAVKGSRLFISETLPIQVSNEVLGVRTTSDKGGDQNKVESTTIKDVADKEVLGTVGVADTSYTFVLDDVTLSQQMAFIGKTVWVYEEIVDTSADETKIGEGIVAQMEFGAIVPAGQEVNNLRTFTQSATLISDEFYYAKPTGDAGSQTFTYTGLTSGATKTLGK